MSDFRKKVMQLVKAKYPKTVRVEIYTTKPYGRHFFAWDGENSRDITEDVEYFSRIVGTDILMEKLATDNYV